MIKTIETHKMSEILLEEFMEPMGISADELAMSIHVPVSEIQDILYDKSKITADTSLRLGKFFGVSDKYFLNIQNDLDMRKMRIFINEELNSSHPCRFELR